MQTREDSPQIVLVVVLFGLGIAIPARADAIRFDESRLSVVSRRMHGFVEQKQLAGAVALVATRDRVAHHHRDPLRPRDVTIGTRRPDEACPL